jgi:hypothetical protein
VLLVNVAASDVRDLDIALDVQASLFGRVNRRDADTGVCNPWMRSASVRLFLAEDFPHGEPVAVTTTDGRGVYEFRGLDAPDDFVVAVYSSATSADALGSQLVQTIPSRHRKVDTFCVEVPS